MLYLIAGPAAKIAPGTNQSAAIVAARCLPGPVQAHLQIECLAPGLPALATVLIVAAKPCQNRTWQALQP